VKKIKTPSDILKEKEELKTDILSKLKATIESKINSTTTLNLTLYIDKSLTYEDLKYLKRWLSEFNWDLKQNSFDGRNGNVIYLEIFPLKKS
jgi:hypothetical protein